MTAPINPVPLGNTAHYMRPDTLANYQNFYAVPLPLRGLDTTVVHLAPNGNLTHLSGSNAGNEGIWLGQNLQGEHQLPFEQVVLESAFQWGATIQRTNYTKRMINLRVVIAAPSEYQYLLCDNRWWEGQDETKDGWLGIFTRWGGWRWVPVRPFKTVDTTQQMDPQAYGNNAAQWDLVWICQRPWFSKPTLFDTWTAQGLTKNKAGYYTGTITLANQGDMQTYVQYLVDAPGGGDCQLQDNNSTRMVTPPKLLASDGPGLVDSDPQERTLTAANDAFDSDYYQLAKASNVLNFFLTNNKTTGTHWWQRGYLRFIYNVPPETVCQFNVAHTNPNATITVMLPQRYKRSR